MENGNIKHGAEKLASVFLREITRRQDSSLVLDFGTIKSNGNLMADTFPVNIGREDYSVLAHCICHGCNCECPVKDKKCCNGINNCHNKAVIKDGEETRVLVAWTGDEPVVIGVLGC